MTKNLYLILFITISLSFFYTHVRGQQSYDKLWKRVENYRTKDLPVSAVKETTTIYKRAKKEKNFSQMLKAAFIRMSLQDQISPDSFIVDIRQIEGWEKYINNSSDLAILHALLGACYLEKTNKMDSRNIDTIILWRKRALKYFRESLKNKEILASVRVDSYLPLIIKRKDGAIFGHDLLSLLTTFVVENLKTTEFVSASEIVNFYTDLALFYEQKGNNDAALLERLNELEIRNNLGGKDKSLKMMSSLEYKIALLNLIVKNKKNPLCADVYNRLLDVDLSYAEQLKYAREAQSEFPRSIFFNKFRFIEAKVLLPQLNVQFKSGIICGDSIDISLNYRNCNIITFKVLGENVPKNAKIQSFKFHLPSDYTFHEKTVRLAPLSAGKYKIVAETKGVTDTCEIHLTTLKLISMPLPDGRTRITVVNNKSGYPIGRCKVLLYEAEDWRSKIPYKETGSVKTDDSGMVILENGKFAKAFLDKNDETDIISIQGKYYYRHNENKQKIIKLYTDRSIYRPGQVVHVAGLIYNQDGDSLSVVSSRKFTIELKDVNDKTIISKVVESNNMGSIDADLPLPVSCLTGIFHLKMDTGLISFHVEEYKRPTYQVLFLPVKGSYSLGDSLCIVGEAKAFSGESVQTAKVKYTVCRTRGFWYRFYSQEGMNRHIATGETQTDDNGRFNIPVFLDKEELSLKDDFWNVSYVITVEITDVAGETQQGKFVLPLAKQSFYLDPEVPLQMKKSDIKEIKVKAFNLKNELIEINGFYNIFKLHSDYKKENALLKGNFSSKAPFLITELSSLPSGDYRCIFSSVNEKGDTIETQKTLVLFSSDEKDSIDMNEDWIYLSSEEFNLHKSADLYFAPKGGLTDTYIFYDVFSGNKLLESKRIVIHDKMLQHFHYEYNSEYGDGISITLMYVKDGICHHFSKNIVLAYPEKKLNLKWETFRDKLYPGQQEEWRLSIRDVTGKNVEAELLASLYDASLDKLYKHEWYTKLDFSRNIPNVTWNPGFHYDTENLWLNFKNPSYKWRQREFDIFKDFFCIYGLISSGDNPFIKGKTPLRRMNSASVKLMEAVPMAKMNKISETEDNELKQITLRENFAETAFFYPHLMTDKKGIATISFTLPESLTEWRFLGLAHTQNMDYGSIDASVKASKEFTIRPNMPRFVREGDEASISARLLNLADRDISGSVKMELIDPETEKVIISQVKPFAVRKGQTGSSRFEFIVTQKYSLLICRIIAEGKSFSDGEQSYLPVLSDKQWVTESVPFTVRDKGTYCFDLDSLFNHNSKTAIKKNLTVELSQAPFWMLLQSLSLLSSPLSNNAVAWSSAYYVNIMVNYLTEHLPKLKNVIEQWKREDREQHSLSSYLEKNETLKNTILEESPWVVDAMRETQHMQQLSDLFDKNRMISRREIALRRLQALQRSDGSWSWFQGMQGNFYVTETVVEQLTKIKYQVGKVDGRIDTLLNNAYKFLDHFVLKEYYDRLKRKENGLPSESVLHYLYISTLAKRPLTSEVKKMQKFYVNCLIVSNSPQTIYGKSLSSFILNAFGEHSKAKELVQSLRENTVFSSRIGRYYDTDKANYSWADYKIPTQVAAMTAMYAMKEDFPDTESYIDDMSLWLIRQKQVQMWDNPASTVQVLFALLPKKDKFWRTSLEPVNITLDGKTVSFDNVSAGIGYVKKSYALNNKSIHLLKVLKPFDGISWGAVYGQYLESLDKLKVQNNNISIIRHLFVKRIKNGKDQWVVMKDNDILNVGEELKTQLIINSDRDIDFLELKNQRAACLEPKQAISNYNWQNGQEYYQSVRDASTTYFFDHFRKGTCVINDFSFVNRTGKYHMGLATVRCAYSTEFGGHSDSCELIVK